MLYRPQDRQERKPVREFRSQRHGTGLVARQQDHLFSGGKRNAAARLCHGGTGWRDARKRSSTVSTPNLRSAGRQDARHHTYQPDHAERDLRLAADGSGLKQLTHTNDAILAHVEMNEPESFWFEGAEGTKVEATADPAAAFSASQKYPMLVLLHGGPQTMWSNAWGYRWNAQVFSGAGYVTLMINRRGSTGFGQKFTDEITNDWGGKAYVDVMKGIDAAIAKYPFIDKSRLAAAGGSYGGYMADWLATHTDRFKAIISHAGVYDKVSMYATEELWFEEHDLQGTPWGAPENYKKWSPSTYAGDLGNTKRRRW